ncbi:MAG: glycosyltransferase family 2 protein [Planctomycetota bacterium]
MLLVTFNVERFVSEAVQSALAQDYRPLRLVIVDDGSTDSTVERARSAVLGATIPVTILELEHRGTSAAFRAGLKACTADWVAILHGDDISRPQRVSLQLAAALATAGTVLVHGEYITIDEDSQQIPGIDSRLDLPPADGNGLRDLLLLRRDVRSMTMFYDRRRFAEAGGYRTEYRSEDWQSILVLASLGHIEHLDSVLVERRIRATSESERVNATRSDFSPGHIGYPLLTEVAPPDLRHDLLGALHSATVIENALARGNSSRATQAFRFAARKFPSERRVLVAAVLRGFRGFIWTAIGRWLPPRVTAAIRMQRSLR